MKGDQIIIHTDGGARGNPGPAACAFVAMSVSEIISKASQFLSITTNNYAEYKGIILALRWVVDEISSGRNVNQIVVNSDSELVVRQLNGLYKIKNVNLKNLYDEIKNIIITNKLEVVFKNISRELNKQADALVNEELDRNDHNV
jgi:ribonuclease HI